MKELSIEEKAEAYDLALGRAKEKYAMFEGMKQGDVLEDVFPELKESERIRKALICHISKISTEIPVGALHRINGVDIPDILAWLEKQKTSEEAIQYLKENHSPSEVSDFQTAMNIAVAKAYDKGVKDGLEKQGQTFTKKELKKISQRMISAEAKEAMYGKPTAWSEEDDDNMMMIEDRLRDYLDYIREDSTLKKHIKNSLKEEVSEYIDWLKSIKQRIIE